MKMIYIFYGIIFSAEEVSLGIDGNLLGGGGWSNSRCHKKNAPPPQHKKYFHKTLLPLHCKVNVIASSLIELTQNYVYDQK